MNKKLHLKTKISTSILLCISMLLLNISTFAQFARGPRYDALNALAKTKIDTNYTIPSYTELKRRWEAAKSNQNNNDILDLFEAAIYSLQDKRMPYNIVMNINGDPKTRMGFNWYNNTNITGGKLEIVKGIANSHSAFSNATPIYAVCSLRTNLKYNIDSNYLHIEAGIPTDSKRSYTENKAVATGLLPGTTYSFRVGGVNGYWSDIGTFTTAKNNKDAFSFIYTTDAQAHTYAQIHTSQITPHKAFENHPDVNFWLQCGDLVNYSDAAWEWEQFFASQQDLFLKIPFAPVIGNHEGWFSQDAFKNHFNMGDFGNTDPHKSTYTYIYGDAQFFAINGELYLTPIYINTVKKWMRDSISAHPDIKWRIVYFHKSAYTGGGGQSDSLNRKWRQPLAQLCDSLNIDITLFGHDHLYQVIGPVYNKDTVAGAVSNVIQGAIIDTINLTGKSGGIFNVKNGTLYFSNGFSGWINTHIPLPLGNMPGIESLDVPKYRYLFTGRFGRPYDPTYSHVEVSQHDIVITTYEVNTATGASTELDKIKVVKYCETDTIN